MAVVAAIADRVLRALGRKQEADQQEFLDSIGVAIAGMRDDAVKARKESGIEDVWTACEEAYLGIDDLNRATFKSSRWIKPTTMDGPLRRPGSEDSAKSTAFVRMTARYVDAGAAKIGEITLPIDDKPFKLDPTPVPDLVSGLEDERQVLDPSGQPATRPATEDDAQAQPGQPVPLTVKDLAQHQIDKAADAAEKATLRIYDWMIEGKHQSHMRKVEFDMARLGVGVLKGPVPKRTRAMSLSKAAGGMKLGMVEKTVPVTLWTDPWNFFPAPDCGESIHEGSYVFERDFLSPPALRKLKQQPNFIESAIDKVLAEGPEKRNVDDDGRTRTGATDPKVFTIWYFYGELERDEFNALNQKQGAEVPEDQKSVFAIVAMVNDTAIRATLNPLESGSFPYQVGCWRRRAGFWAGVGVSEQVSLPQKAINGATRAMFNNAGKSSDVVTVIDRGCIDPADGNWAQTPGKTYFKKAESAATDDVRKAFSFFTVPNTTAQLMTIIDYAFKLAEESTSIPLITQGQSGDTTPDTFSGMQLQNNNANQLLRDVGYAIADDITNPLVEKFYEWLLLDPDVPNDEKGDYQVNCNAAAAMIERAIQDQTVMQMGQMVGNPAFGIDPKKWFASMARSKRLDPREFQYSPADQARIDQNQSPPVPIAVAQIRAQTAEKVAASHDQAAVEKMKADTDRDTVYANAEAKRADDNAKARIEELQIKRDVANLDYQTKLMEYATRKDISLEKAKTELAKTAMELNVQRELAGADGKGPQVATPAVEPAGRAPDGEAFQK